MLDPSALLTLIVILGVLGSLAMTRWAPDLVLVAGVLVLMLAGVVSPEEALAGLSNRGVVTVAVLYIVAAGLQETGAMTVIMTRILGARRPVRPALARLLAPVVLMSAFLNNTPIVAALIPAVRDWARRSGLSPSPFLLPLSYAAILGGTCTLIGTSTNLVVAGLVDEAAQGRTDLAALSMFDITPLGLPVAVAGLVLLVLLAPVLVPDRKPVIGVQDDPQEYTVELEVQEGSPVVGKSIEEAGLRHLPGAFVIELVRDGHVLAAVAPTERIQAKDRLVFAGVLESVVDLQRIPGLLAAAHQVHKLDGPRAQRQLVEAVVAPANPLIGRTIREGRFRNTFGGVVVAVARHGRRLGGKLGDIPLQAGDVLLVEGPPEFAARYRGRREFHLVSPVPDSSPLRYDRALLAAVILFAMVLVAATELLPMLVAAFLAGAALLWTGCLGVKEARRAIDWQVLIAIAAAFGLGKAVQNSGLDQIAATWVIEAGSSSPLWSLVLVYLVTSLLTEVVTNNAAAVLAFPISMEVADLLGVSPLPFIFTIMMAASAAFLTPIGYQTNLMVYGPGGYRLSDYFRLGLPMNLLTMVLTTGLAPRIWPF